jgi:hypothetical protein
MLAEESGKEKGIKEKLEVNYMTVFCCPSCSLAFFNKWSRVQVSLWGSS